MKAFERHYQILMILNEKRYVTVSCLANEIDVSERTILRDISYLSEFLPIRTTQGRYGGGVSFINDYRYCDYKFYMEENCIKVLNKVVFEIKTYGFCTLSLEELKSVAEIIDKYSPPSYAKVTDFVKIS